MNLTLSDDVAGILDAMPEAYVYLDGEFTCVFANLAAERLLGKSRDGWLGNLLWAVYPELAGTVFEENCRRAMTERAPVTFEDFRESQQRWYRITAIPGPECGIVVHLADLTERKRGEAASANESRLVQAIFSLIRFAEDHSLGELLQQSLDEVCDLTDSKVGFYHFVLEDQRTLSLQVWSTLTQRDYCKAEGQGLHYDLDLAGVWADCVREGKAVIHNDYPSLPRRRGLPPGHAEVVRELVIPVFKRGRIVAILGVGNKSAEYGQQDLETVARFAGLAWDVAEHKRTEEALRESEARFRELFDSAPVAYHELDRDGVIRRVNQAESALLGYPVDDMLGRPVWEFVVEADRSASREAIRRKLSGEQPLEPVERRYAQRDGRELCLEVHDKLVRNARGETVGIRSALLDVTERKRVEAYREMDREVLQILNEPGNLQKAIQRVLAALSELTGCDAVGMRLQEGEDFPYIAQQGFSRDFLLTENTLVERDSAGGVCRDQDGNVRLECTCGLVISGKTDPANPHFTQGGSFWTNDSFPLLRLPPAEDPRLHPRNLCIHHGYASVALVPIRNKGRIVGLIHLNDRRKGRFTLDTIELIEGIASHIGEALMRKQTEENLRESERQLLDSQRVAGLGSYSLEIPSGNWKSSAVLDEVFGIGKKFVRSIEGWVSLIHPEWREGMADYLANQVIKQHVRFDREYKIVRLNDGCERWVHGIGELEFDAEGQPVRMLGTILDITERKRELEEKSKLEAQFHQAQKMESVGRLAGGVAHDFNNLLTVINGYSQMLLAELRVGDPLRDSIDEIHKAGERAAGLTRQLLAFSRKQVLEPRKLDVNRVVEEMRPMLERLVGEDIELCIALHAEGGAIHADPHQFEQVVMNLVVNARDAMPGVGKLLVETANVVRDVSYAEAHPEARVGRYVMLAVSDTGVGMDEETKNRIFEPFFTTKAVGKGTGLGLSMVQGVVAQSGGYVEVYSEKGNGTTFKIYLPALADGVVDAPRPATIPAQGGKETVLVVEDQGEVRKYAAAVLKGYGYRVIPAESAADALLFCGRERIDLVLTDVVMPNVNGRELADRLAVLQPAVKVLFMSGYTDSVIEHHGVLDAGASFIQKPFSPQELAEKVRAVLGPPSPAARILVADDEAGVRGFLRDVLEQGGYEVIEAADGKQAYQRALAGRVDLVITDLVMPEQEGIETIRALRREMPGVRIIAISGAFDGQFLETAKMLGADAVLNKPVGAGLLLARVTEALQLRR